MRLFFVDSNDASTRAIAHAAEAHAINVLFSVNQVFYYKRVLRRSLLDSFRMTRIGPRSWQGNIVVPGWQRAQRTSTQLVRLALECNARRLGEPDAIVFTSPFYAGLIDVFPRAVKIYYAWDTFRHYAWRQDLVLALERRLLRECDFTLAVSRTVVDDFIADGGRRVLHSPMAISSEDIAHQPGANTPAELASLERPIVTCSGFINRLLDWDLIEAIGDAMPDFTFIFLGKIVEEAGPARERILRALERPNFIWLGHKPRDQLISYLSASDVLINPMRVTAHNHRRAPFRLFEYMATGRPILSSAIREAFEHAPFVEIATRCEDWVTKLRALAANSSAERSPARTSHISKHTWEVRARQLLTEIAASRGLAVAG